MRLLLSTLLALALIFNVSECKSRFDDEDSLDYVLLTKQISAVRKEQVAVTLAIHEKNPLKASDFLTQKKVTIEADSVATEYFNGEVDFTNNTLNMLNGWTVKFETKEKKNGGKLKMKIDRSGKARVLAPISAPHNISRVRDFSKGTDNITFVFDKEPSGKTYILTVPYFHPWNQNLIMYQQLLDIFSLDRPAPVASYSFYYDGIYFYWENVSTTAVRLFCFHESAKLATFAASGPNAPQNTSANVSGETYFISLAASPSGKSFTQTIPENIAMQYGLYSSVDLHPRATVTSKLQNGPSVRQCLLALGLSLIVCVAYASL